MTIRAILPFFALLPAFAAETTQAVLARMDTESASLRQVTAHFDKITYTAVLKDSSQESGTLWVKRSGRTLLMRSEVQQPEPYSAAFEGATVQKYFPKLKTVQVFDLSSYRGLVDQFMLLGFGSSGKELLKSYSVSVGGQETIASRACTRLELVPKSQKARDQFSKIELWIPLDAGYPVQQKLWQPGGDYYLVKYSDIKLNPGLPDEAFRLKLPPGVTKEYPQKQ